MNEVAITRDQLKTAIDEALARVEVVDMHTHLFPAEFSGMLLWGIDEVLTYHYLIAEYFRCSQMDCDRFFTLPKARQAELVWQALFLERSPVSEAQREYSPFSKSSSSMWVPALWTPTGNTSAALSWRSTSTTCFGSPEYKKWS